VAIIIKGGTIIDGSGNEPIKGDVLIEGDKIVAVVESIGTTEGKLFDARGFVVCPGFIDIHSHTDFTLYKNPLCESKLRQGVTTEVVGNCGFSPAPVNLSYFEELVDFLTNTTYIKEDEKLFWHWKSQKEYLEFAFSKGVAVNIASLVGHGTLRISVGGAGNAPLKASQLEHLLEILEREIDLGAKGLSLGLQYEPGKFADKKELYAIGSLLASKSALLSVHMRDEGDWVEENVKEMIELSFKTGVNLQISHLKAEGKNNWGKSERLIQIIDAAKRKRKCSIDYDVYPYKAFGSSLMDLLPSWAKEGGFSKLFKLLNDETASKAILKEMNTIYSGKKDWSDYRITFVAGPNKFYEGQSIEEIAKMKKCTPEESILDLIRENRGAIKMVVFGMCDSDVERLLSYKEAIIASDGRAVAPKGELGEGKIHPRYYGTFPRVLGHYVRDRGLFTLEEAVKKMTYLPAKKVGLEKRGLLREGYFADIVVFDPTEIRDLATFQNPHVFAKGIKAVFVNGEEVLIEGEYTLNRPGRMV